MLRAVTSVALNLEEGSAKGTVRDHIKFYRIALGSQRECLEISDLVRDGLALVLILVIVWVLTSTSSFTPLVVNAPN